MNQTKDDELQNFAHNIRWLREKHQLSKREMAKILKVSIKTLNRIEAEDIPDRLTVRVFFRVWAYFGIHPKEQLNKRLDE